MHKDFYCAYHQNQIISEFCKCEDCLLPACFLCVKLHTQQHTLNKTKPEYENITVIFKKINKQLKEIAHLASGLGNSLLLIQKDRKQKMKQIRKSINSKRKQIIQSFQNALKNFDEKIIKIVYQMDNQFIQKIQQLDDRVLYIQRQVEAERCGIQSQDSLKTIISYFEGQKFKKLNEKIHRTEQQIEKFNSKFISLKFSNNFNQKIQELIDNFVMITQRSQQEK